MLHSFYPWVFVGAQGEERSFLSLSLSASLSPSVQSDK